jgi:hypothetical protein
MCVWVFVVICDFDLRSVEVFVGITEHLRNREMYNFLPGAG